MAERSKYSKEEMQEFLRLKDKHFKIQQKILQASRAENREADHALMQQRRAMVLMTRQVSSASGALGTVMNMLQSVGGMGLGNLQDKGRLRDKVKSGRATDAEKTQFSMLSQSKTTSFFEKMDKRFDKSFGQDSKWNKMFAGKGKAAAVGLGIGAAGAGLGLTSKIIDSSPLMQQMLKLLNFGIMLILRPIGDFFGMLMRPILILLLRKFIIPFYQTVYPWFLNTANSLTKSGEIFEEVGDSIVKSVEESGKFITAKLEPVITKDVAGTNKVTGFKVNPLETVLKNITKKIIPTALAATPTIKPSTKPPVFKSKLQDLAKIDNPKNLPVKKMRTPWLNNQALAKAKKYWY